MFDIYDLDQVQLEMRGKAERVARPAQTLMQNWLLNQSLPNFYQP